MYLFQILKHFVVVFFVRLSVCLPTLYIGPLVSFQQRILMLMMMLSCQMGQTCSHRQMGQTCGQDNFTKNLTSRNGCVDPSDLAVSHRHNSHSGHFGYKRGVGGLGAETADDTQALKFIQ